MNLGGYTGEVITLVAGGVIGWLSTFRRQRADTKQVEVDVLEKALMTINEKVVQPLTDRFSALQGDYETVLRELKQLRNAITKMYICRHVTDCPIKLELQVQQADDRKSKRRKQPTNRQREPGGEGDHETGDGTGVDGEDNSPG